MNQPTSGPETPKRPLGPMPDWQQRQLARLLQKLSAWRSDDHEDAITLCRSDVICLLDAIQQSAAPSAEAKEYDTMLATGVIPPSLQHRFR